MRERKEAAMSPTRRRGEEAAPTLRRSSALKVRGPRHVTVVTSLTTVVLLLFLQLLLLSTVSSLGAALRHTRRGKKNDDPCANVKNADTDCRCGEQPCNYCYKCDCYGCFTAAGFEMAEEELSPNPIQASTIEDGRTNPE